MPDLIVAQRLRKEYVDLVAVNDIDLAISAGEIFGLIGPNGAGKTTTLRMMATTLEPTGGSVLFDGTDIWRDPTAIRRQMGFMPDFFQMYNRLTVREIFTYFGIAHRMSGAALTDRVNEVIRLIELQDKADSMASGLSRGMVQRLGLGRAILHRPKLLLLDEPASGLDPLGRMQLFKVLREVNAQGTTILISSHILGELSEICTSVGIMHGGRFLEAGPTEAIIRKIMPRRQMAIHLVGPVEAAMQVLTGYAKVVGPQVEGKRIDFFFEGEDEDLARLNADMVRAGAAVARLEETRATLNDVYMAIAQRSADAPSL